MKLMIRIAKYTSDATVDKTTIPLVLSFPFEISFSFRSMVDFLERNASIRLLFILRTSCKSCLFVASSLLSRCVPIQRICFLISLHSLLESIARL